MTIEPILIIAGYWVFSAVVGGMPEPESSASVWYRWGFSSLHILAGNILMAVQSRYKGLGGIPEQLPPDSIMEHKEATTVITANPRS